MVDSYRIVDIITKASVVPGTLLNVLLIFLVGKYSRSEIGTFRYLLMVFAGYDILLIILHSVFDPKSIVMPGIFCIVLDFKHGNQFLTCLHYILFMVSYDILITHLLYRYWVIRRPYRIVLFSNPKFILLLIIISAGMVALLVGISLPLVESDDSSLVATIREKFRHDYGIDIPYGWVVADYWKGGKYNVLQLLAVGVYDVVGGGIVITVVTLASLTYRHISAAYTLSSTTRNAQMRLLKTVCVQTFIPMVCVMIPYFCNMTLPIFGFTLRFVTETTGLMMAFFPTWDPLAVIVLMKPYREGLKTLLGIQKKTHPNISATFTVTQKL